MDHRIEVRERLYGNWSCKMNDWPALGELIDGLNRGGCWSMALSYDADHVAFLSGDGAGVAVEGWSPSGLNQFMGMAIEDPARRGDAQAIELERNEEYPDDGTWLLVPADLMLTTADALDVVARMVAGNDVPFTLVPA